jgi:hypothetical protein
MKKLSFILSFAFLLPAFALAQVPIAVSANANVQANLGQSNGYGSQNQASSSAGGVHASATGTAQMNAHASTTSGEQGTLMSEAHQSVVASFVQSLLADANRDGGIGAEVRAVAKSQSDSASTTADAIVKVENRSGVLSFLIGSDWKNIGVLRSEIAKGTADTARLQTAIKKTTAVAVRADLEAQLGVLKTEQAKIEAFVDAHENSFSLFGWFTKLF